MVPAPGESVGSIGEAGAITVVYGSTTGLEGTSARTFSQDSPGVAGTSTVRGRWGQAVAAGDFDGDGYEDLAVGAQQSVASVDRVGTVTILWGSLSGLATNGSVMYTAHTAGETAAYRAHARFGAALAAGDLNSDGRDELAVGVPGLDYTGVQGGGLVSVLAAAGRRLRYAWELHQGSNIVNSGPETGDAFGSAVAIGDVNGDGFGDVIVGVPGEDAGPTRDVGEVDVWGPHLPSMRFLDGDVPAAAGRRLGTALAIQHGAHYDGAWAYAPGASSSGFVVKLDAARDKVALHTHGAAGSKHGAALVFGHFSATRRSAIAIAEPADTPFLGGRVIVHDLPGTSTPLVQESIGVPGFSESNDAFGTALAVGDYNGDGLDDLVIGVPFESIGAIESAGVFYVFPGNAGGINTQPSTTTICSQESHGIPGASESGDEFGYV